MSEFSSLLSDCIHQKGYSIRGLAQRLGMPSTTLTKLCNNTRSAKNQRENIQRICEVLMLTPAQHKKLLAAFEAELVGVEVFNSRLSVKKLLESMDCRQLMMRPRQPKGIHLPTLGLAEKENDTYAMVRNFLLNACEEGKSLDLLFSPDNAVILEILRNAMASYPIKVRHIMCMHVSDNATGSVNAQNIETVQKIVPLFLGGTYHENGYMPYYYYERSPVGSNCLMFPNVMISARGVLFCTGDYSHCLYSEEKNVLRFFGKLFERQLGQCRPLITTEKNFIGQLKRFIRLGEMSEGSQELIAVSWQPRLIQVLSETELKTYLPPATSFRSEVIDTYLRYLKCISGHRHLETYFTKEGLVDFAANGFLRDIPQKTMGGSLPPSLRRLLLTRLLHQAEAGETHLHLAREGVFAIARDAKIICYGSDTLAVAGLNYESDGRICFVEELGTNWSVLDFLENLKDSSLFLSESESIQVVRQVLHTYLPETPISHKGAGQKAAQADNFSHVMDATPEKPITAR